MLNIVVVRRASVEEVRREGEHELVPVVRPEYASPEGPVDSLVVSRRDYLLPVKHHHLGAVQHLSPSPLEPLCRGKAISQCRCPVELEPADGRRLACVHDHLTHEVLVPWREDWVAKER